MKTSLLTLCLLLLFAATEAMAGVLRVGSWSSPGATPHSTLTSALAAAKPGDDIWVAQGVYREAEYIIPFGVRLFGGFSGTETQAFERNYAINVTILDGSGAHRVATVSGLLDGFTLRNGRTGDNGGGAYVKIGGQISHCILFANEAGYDGGAIFVEPTITNNLLTGNRAGNDGAGISGTRGYSASNNTVVNNLFTGVPVIDALSGVPSSLAAGGVLDVAPPAISDDGGSTVLMKGWELDGHAIPMPYTVTYADNGKKLRYWAANAVGVGVSNEVALTVTWTVTSSAQLLTPKAVCEGTTLIAAGIGNPVFSPAPDGGATYTYYIDGTPISGLDHALQYSDNGKLLTCEIRNGDGSIVGATTPAVRLAVMKAPDVLLTNIGNLSIEEGQPLCLPTPVVISNGSDVTAQGWKWRIGTGGENTFNSCDKAITAMNGATVYYTAENGCSTTPTETTYTTLTVTNLVGEFLQTVSALCAGMTLDDCISFADGGNTGDYYIGTTKLTGSSWDDVKATALSVAHNLQVLRFSYNGGKSERRMTLTVHAVPEITTDPATPADALCLGDAHTLTVAATGDNLSYQWERSVNSTTGTDGDWISVPGSTTAACRLTADVTAYYRCTVTGVCIDKSVAVSSGKITSAAAQLTVNDRPVIPDITTLNPLTICEGEDISTLLTPLKPTLGGTPATAEGWTLGGISIADNYSVVSTDNGKVLGYHAGNACGERTATYSTLKLTVDSKPRVTQDPLDVTVVEDTPVRLSVSALGGNLTYRWQQKAHAGADIDANWHDIPGETTPVYSFTAANITTDVALDGADVLTDYRCVVGTTNACATITVAPALATVTVTRSKAAVSIRRQPAAYEVCNSAAVPYEPGFTVEVEGSGLFVYKWYGINDKTNPVAQTPASGNLDDAVDDKTNTFQPTAAGTYFCVVTSTDDHAGAQTQTVMLTVSQAPVINGITPANATICEGSSVTLGVDGRGSALTYQWYQQTGTTPDPLTDTPKGTAPTYTPVGLTATATFYCVVGSGSACTETPTSASVVVMVEQAPKITTQPVSQAVCGATGVSLNVVATNTDTYQWYHNGLPVAEADGGKVDVLTGVTEGGVYTCVVSKTGGLCGEATSVPALITVASEPTVNLGSRINLTACAGDLVTLPSPEIETGGSVIVPEKTGWYLSTEADPTTAPLVASFAARTTDATYHYKLTYKCSEGGAETVLTPADGLPSLTVGIMAAAPMPTFTTGTSAATTCDGDAVTLPTVSKGIGTRADGWWELYAEATATAGEPKGDIAKYKVCAADNGKVFKYVNVNSCGVRTVSTNIYTLQVKQPARITSLLPSTTVIPSGTAVNLTAPSASNFTSQKWLLRSGNTTQLSAAEQLGTSASLTSRTMTLADNGKLITYAVEGCNASPDETSTILSVTKDQVADMASSSGNTRSLRAAPAARVDETSTALTVWAVPTFSNDVDAGILVAQAGREKYTYPARPGINMNNTILTAHGWVREGSSTTAAFLQVGALAQLADHNVRVCYQVRYTEPGNSTVKAVNSRVMGTLTPWDVPVMETPAVDTWNYICENKTFRDMGKGFKTVNIADANYCTIASAKWETESSREVTVDSRPQLAEDNTSVYCAYNWTAPGNKATGKVRKPIAQMRVNNTPTLTFNGDQSGTQNIVFIGQPVNVAYNTRPSDYLNTALSTKYNDNDGSGTLSSGMHSTRLVISTNNACGSYEITKTIDLNRRSCAYYAAFSNRLIYTSGRPAFAKTDGCYDLGRETLNLSKGEYYWNETAARLLSTVNSGSVRYKGEIKDMRQGGAIVVTYYSWWYEGGSSYSAEPERQGHYDYRDRNQVPVRWY